MLREASRTPIPHPHDPSSQLSSREQLSSGEKYWGSVWPPWWLHSSFLIFQHLPETQPHYMAPCWFTREIKHRNKLNSNFFFNRGWGRGSRQPRPWFLLLGATLPPPTCPNPSLAVLKAQASVGFAPALILRFISSVFPPLQVRSDPHPFFNATLLIKYKPSTDAGAQEACRVCESERDRTGCTPPSLPRATSSPFCLVTARGKIQGNQGGEESTVRVGTEQVASQLGIQRLAKFVGTRGLDPILSPGPEAGKELPHDAPHDSDSQLFHNT